MAEGPDLAGVRRLLFVGTGNTCRSPLAEALARAGAEGRGLDGLEVRSAGTMASGGSPASRGAAQVAREVGLDVTPHRSTEVSEEVVGWADLVLCMAPSHGMDVQDVAPGAPTVLLTDFLPPDHELHGRPVSDPVGGGIGKYRETLAVLREAVTAVLERIEGA